MRMMRFDFLMLLLISTANFQCSEKVIPPSPAKIVFTSYAPVNPILKGLATNPQIRVALYIPSGNENLSYKKLRCSINAEALGLIQKLDVFMPNTETFSSGNVIASITPSSTNFEIPVDLRLNPGTYYIWFSTVLKSDAEINSAIEIHCTALVDAQDKPLTVTEFNLSFKKLTGAAVRKGGDDGVNTYRIPGIITTDRGTLISVYDKRNTGSGDLPGDIDVAMSRSVDGGKSWEAMKVIMDMGLPHDQNGIGDPSILFDPATKKIWVAALWSKGNRSISGSGPGLTPDETGQFVLVSSSDDGRTWSVPISITSQVKIPSWNILFNGPGSGICMQDGKLVFAAQYWNENRVPYSTIIFSEDNGLSWKGKVLGPKSNTTESQLVETTPGTLMLNMRDNRGGFRSVATTNNMGATWTDHATSYNTLPDPVCMGSLIKAVVNVNGQQKEVLFFSNPNTSSGRYNITIKASLDLGQTWLPANQLLIDERLCYGYSCLTKIDDNTIGILYEGTKDLYFVKVPVNSIVR